VPPYAYVWSSNESTEDATALCTGINTVSVLDNNECIQGLTVTINSAAFSAVVNQSNSIQCNGECNGVLSVSTTGGTPPIQYVWSNGETGQIVNDLCNGTYTVSINDANGCTIVDTQTLTEPTKINLIADVSDASCNSSNGEIEMTVNGGQPGYTYLWNNGATTPIISGLSIGTYTLTLTDDNGCCNVLSLIVDEDDCCTNTSNPCVDAIQGTLDICTEISADPTIPLATIDCDGDGVTNADECADATNPLDPCDYVDTSITLPVVADQSGCPLPCPDLTPVTTVLPGNIAGNSVIEVAVAISEIRGIDTDGSIISLRVPSDPRLVFVWSIGQTQAAGIPVQNSDWNYLGDNGVFHNWTYNGSGLVLSGNDKSAIGFQAFYDPQGTDGQTTITATVVPLSGGDCNIVNNTDSERLVYFK